MENYIDNLRSFLDAQQFVAMLQDSDKLDFIAARYSERHGTALGTSKKHWLLLDRNEASFLGLGELRLEMPYALYLRQRK